MRVNNENVVNYAHLQNRLRHWRGIKTEQD